MKNSPYELTSVLLHRFITKKYNFQNFNKIKYPYFKSSFLKWLNINKNPAIDTKTMIAIAKGIG